MERKHLTIKQCSRVSAASVSAAALYRPIQKLFIPEYTQPIGEIYPASSRYAPAFSSRVGVADGIALGLNQSLRKLKLEAPGHQIKPVW